MCHFFCFNSINFNDSIDEIDSLDVSISSSLKAPRIPFFPAKTLPISLCFFASSIKAPAVALMTEVTPPD